MKIAIMQPAFSPPASYFRLFAATDLFVILDTVQFDRRWFTHRQKLTDRTGKKQWLTLPLAKQPRDTTRIMDLVWWADRANEKWKKQITKFPYMAAGSFLPISTNPIDFVIRILREYCAELQIPWNVQYASDIEIPSNLSGQDRIIAICKKLGATEYINSPGGRDLYDEEAFSKEEIKLTFLEPWVGSYDSVLERMMHEKPENIREEIYAQI